MNETMDISVRVYPPRKNDPAAAAASVCLNGCFVVRGIRIVEGINGPFVSMPSRKTRSGNKNGGKNEYRDTCFPCTPAFREQFNSAVLDAYQRYKEREQADQDQTGPEAAGPEERSDSAEQAEQEVIV